MSPYWLRFWMSCVVLLSVIGSASAQVQYVYDELGRLTGVIAPTGDAARYVYDATGNIVSVQSATATSTSVIDFTPKSGLIGAAVTLWGTGFSATPSLNTVQFNGTNATVTSATPNRLSVTVPAGASTGPISITTPNGAASTASAFTVIAASNAPTVSGFTPSIGVVGTAVTINGTYFQSTALENRVRFNLTGASVSTLTSTQIQTAVPPVSSSGPISVRTRYGTGTSAADFFVVPTDKSVADIGYTGRLSVGGADINVSLAANKTGLVLFSGTQGQIVGAVISANTFAPLTLKLLSTGGATLYSTSVTGVDTVVFPKLPVTGTYTIRLDTSAAGSATLGAITSTPIVPDGASNAVATTRPGENAILTFEGTAGEWLGIGVTGLSFSAGSSTLNVWVYKPDGSFLTSPTPESCSFDWSATGSKCAIRGLPATGRYSIVISPNGSATASMSVTLSRQLTGTLVANGSPITYSSSRVGQFGKYTFAGTAGANVTLAATGSNLNTGKLYVFKPDGALWATEGLFNSDQTYDYYGLPVTGTYTVMVVPPGLTLGTITLALRAEVTGSLVVDGASNNVSLLSGQSARYSFTGTAGQWLGLGISSLSYGGGSSNATVWLYHPDGSLYTTYNPRSCSGNWVAPGSNCSMRTLPVNGTYSLLIDTNAAGTASMTVTLSSGLTGTLVANGAAMNFSTTRPGQHSQYTFTGNSGENFSLLTSGSTFSGDVYILKPDGTQLATDSITPTARSLDLPSLPVSGTYSVLVVPAGVATGTVSVALKKDATGTLALNGTPSAIALLAGQNGRYTFTGTAGQWLGLGISGLSFGSGSSSVSATVYKPDGSALSTPTPQACATAWSAPGGRCSLRNLPVSGTYTVLINPAGTGTASMTATLSGSLSGTLTPNGASIGFSTTRVGQNSQYTFAGTAGQNFSVLTTSGTFTGWAYVMKPDGTQLTFGNISTTNAVFDLVSIPDTGTYTVMVVPSGVATGSVSVALKQDATGTLTLNGTPSAISLQAGQNGRYTFTGTAGDWVGLGLSALSFGSGSTSVSASVLKPDGTALSAPSPQACGSAWSAPAGRCAMRNLPTSGTYTVVINPAGTGTASMTATLSGDLTGTLTVNGSALAFNTTRVGQYGHYGFTVTAGQAYRVLWSGSTIAAGWIYVLKPDGTQETFKSINSSSQASGTISLGTLSTGGLYQVFVSPSLANTGQVSVQVLSP